MTALQITIYKLVCLSCVEVVKKAVEPVEVEAAIQFDTNTNLVNA